MDELEQDVIELLLRGNDPVLNTLRVQAEKPNRRRQLTGVGFYTELLLPSDVDRLPGSPSFAFGDVVEEITGLNFGAGFVMVVEAGAVKMLEHYSYDEDWPQAIECYHLAYASGDERDFCELQRSLGWPI